MKKHITLITLFFSIYLTSQSFIDHTSITLGFGPYVSEKLDSYLAGNVNVTLHSDEHLFGVSFETGSQFSYGNNPDKYITANLLYGRNLELSDSFSLELISGLGYYTYKELDATNREYVDTINLPLKTNILFDTNKVWWFRKFGIGISANINNQNITSSFLLLTQINF